MNKAYGDDFYSDRHIVTQYAAEKVLAEITAVVPPISSAVDIGCGVGTWLKILRDTYGCQKILGLDGHWVDSLKLVIPISDFRATDLSRGLDLKDDFDLAISLEVAEHLPESCAEPFVTEMCRHANMVLFSAAIPGQTGTCHINTQWQNYWVSKFSRNEFIAFDFIRRTIWNEENIPFYYKQNILFFVRRDIMKNLDMNKIREKNDLVTANVVHPELYLHHFAKLGDNSYLLKRVWKNFRGKRQDVA